MCDSARDEGAASSASRAATRDGDVALLVARNDRYSGARACRSRERERDVIPHSAFMIRLLDSSSFYCSVTSFCVPVKGAV